jgi:acetolactate synthase-1/2/3 large subunit
MEIDKAYKADYALVSDAKRALVALIDALEKKVGPRPPARVDHRDYEAQLLLPRPGGIHPGKLAQSIGRMLPPRGILLADAGAHLAWLGYFVELADGQNFRKPGTFGPMAGHVNGAIGLKLAHPDRAVVVGCGDGCYSLSGFELMTAVEHSLPVVWIIFNDGEFKLIKLFQLSAFMESGLVEFQNPDFAAYARACNADGYTVETLEEFERAYAAALASKRPSVIDAKISRLALPHYSPSPEGTIAGVLEMIEARFRGGS